MDRKQGNKMISELNGEYWGEILFEAYGNLGMEMMYNDSFLDFVKMYCGA